MQGLVKRFNDYHGWGFIAGDDGQDYFVHQNEFHHLQHDSLRAGERVEFQPHRSSRGWSAHAVLVVEAVDAAVLETPPMPTVESQSYVTSPPASTEGPVSPVGSLFSRDFLQSPEYFVGRDEQIRNAYRSILASQDVLIFGSRGVGKSSFAEMLYQALRGESVLRSAYQLPAPGGPVLAVKHMCGTGENLATVSRGIAKRFTETISWGENFRLLVGGIGRWAQDVIVAVNLKDANDNVLNPRAFAEIVRGRLASGQYEHVVIFIDELENMVFERPDDAMVPVSRQATIRQPERNIASFAREVRQALPEQYRRISFVLAGPTHIVDSLKQQGPGWYQRVDPYALPNLSIEESKRAVRLRLEGKRMTADESALELMAQACGGIPLVLIQAAELAASCAANGSVDVTTCRRALEKFAQVQRSKSFSSSLLNASDLERKVFLAIADIDKEWFSVTEIAAKVGESYQKCTPILQRLTVELHLAYDEEAQRYALYDGIGKVYMRIVQHDWDRNSRE